MRYEQLRAGVAKKRVLAWIDQLQLFRAQLRDRMRDFGGKGAAQIDKACAPLLVGNGFDSYLRICHAIGPVS